jgi:hypothetical protein
MLRITNLRNGTVLNRNNGVERDDSLEFIVEGVCESPGQVKVNGVAAERNNLVFRSPVRLTGAFNEIIVQTKNNYGEFRQSVKVVWDRQSFKRYGFFIDDNVFFLTDIHKDKSKSLFDHFYLKKLLEFHKNYGTKFVLNLFYRNDHAPFIIKDFPDRYKSEWRDNADWLQLSFHAYSEFPDRPYQNATPQKLAADYDLVKSEVVRFAGEQSFQPPIVIHWGMLPPDNFHVLSERGVKVLSGGFIDTKTYVGEADRTEHVTDIGYYQDLDKSLYLLNNHVLYDFEHALVFVKFDVTANLLRKDEITAQLKQTCANPVYNETIGLATHEQYSFPYYPNHIPDHHERMEAAIRCVTDRGYAPVFFHDGFLGNTADVPGRRP